jgi:hypothetical protein
MIKPIDISNALRRATKNQGPLLLSVAAGVGTLTTAYLAGKASFTAAEIIQNDEELKPPYDNKKDQFKGRAKLVWKLYIPTAISAGCTIACIASSNRVATKKTLAAHSALAVTQRAFGEYRDKVIDEFGARKDESVRAKVAADRVAANPPPAEGMVIAGAGNVLCFEQHTGRYFMSDMETLLSCQNKLNSKLLKHDFQTLSDWYYLIGLEATSLSHEVGWSASRGLMEIEPIAILSEDKRPCIAFDYNYVEVFGKPAFYDD